MFLWSGDDSKLTGICLSSVMTKCEAECGQGINVVQFLK